MIKIKRVLALLIVFLLIFTVFTQTALASTYVKKGSRGDEVKRVQQRLYELGYPVGDIDGVAGNATIEALILFQKNNGLEADGVAGPKTLEIMFSGVTSESPQSVVENNNEEEATQNANVSSNNQSAPTYLSMSTLKMGSKGYEVSLLQTRLNELGYAVGTPDGDFGSKTFNAVMAFQKVNNLYADGVAGPKTLEIMFSGVTSGSPQQVVENNDEEVAAYNANVSNNQSAPTNMSMSTLKMGSKGNQVTLLQTRLNELGYAVGTPDGEFGAKTFNAVMTFQRVNNLNADGVAGPATIAKLFGTEAVVKPEGQSDVSSTALGEAVVAFAKQYLGKPYVYGGNGPNSFDCSGFTCFVFKNFNVYLPRVAADQRSAGYEVKKADLIPGDLILFTSPGSGSSIGHAGIYIGNGEFIHASSGSSMRVIISGLNSSGYINRFVTARRVLP